MATGQLVSHFDCPSCGSSVTLRATGVSLSAICQNCFSVIGTENEKLQILGRFKDSQKITPLIPLGTRGEMEGIQFEVIGFLQRTDGEGLYPWREYLLFNPYQGFRWLVEAQGHWSFVTMLKKNFFSTNESAGLKYKGNTYTLYQQGSAKVAYVWGEFYWRIKQSDRVKTRDYISPPYMLSLEQNQDEIIWSHAVYQEPEVIQKAFNIQERMPYPLGIAPHQPSFWGVLWNEIKWLSGFFFIIAIILHYFAASLNPQSVYHLQNLTYSSKTKTQTTDALFGIQSTYLNDSSRFVEYETPLFELKNAYSVVEIGLWAEVNNAWLASHFELVNNETEESFSVESEVAYYEGYDSDGGWSEGSNSTSKTISSVPKGKYFLRAETEADPKLKYCKYQIRIRDGAIPISNLFLALSLIAIVPLFVFWRRRSFEVERWFDSDYSPYPTYEE